jgi:hypothetical protein
MKKPTAAQCCSLKFEKLLLLLVALMLSSMFYYQHDSLFASDSLSLAQQQMTQPLIAPRKPPSKQQQQQHHQNSNSNSNNDGVSSTTIRHLRKGLAGSTDTTSASTSATNSVPTLNTQDHNQDIIPKSTNVDGDVIQVDIAVPVSGEFNDPKLVTFVKNLGKSIADFYDHRRSSSNNINSDQRRPVAFRILITRYFGVDISTNNKENDNNTSLLQVNDLQNEINGLVNQNDGTATVEFVPIKTSNDEYTFNRAHAISGLQDATCRSDSCLFVVLDVDMTVHDGNFFDWIISKMETKTNNRFAYFPIVWSDYDPEQIQLYETIFAIPPSSDVVVTAGMHHIEENEEYRCAGDCSDRSYRPHLGRWRIGGYDTVVMTGSLLSPPKDGGGEGEQEHVFHMSDTKFTGWGGEDANLYGRVEQFLEEEQKKLAQTGDNNGKAAFTLYREREPGLVHGYHEKSCELGSFVNERYHDRCLDAKRKYGGPDFTHNLVKREEPEFIEYLLGLEPSHDSPPRSTVDEGKQWLDTERNRFELEDTAATGAYANCTTPIVQERACATPNHKNSDIVGSCTVACRTIEYVAPRVGFERSTSDRIIVGVLSAAKDSSRRQVRLLVFIIMCFCFVTNSPYEPLTNVAPPPFVNSCFVLRGQTVEQAFFSLLPVTGLILLRNSISTTTLYG